MALGVIGGLGPMATARFMEMVTEMTDAACDQDHIEMLIHSCPSIPDRTAYILGGSQDDPVGPMIRIGKNLAAQGSGMYCDPVYDRPLFFSTACRREFRSRSSTRLMRQGRNWQTTVWKKQGSLPQPVR